MRLEDGSGYKVILEAAPEGMYSENAETGVAAMSAMIEKYVRAYPSQYMWTMKRFKKRPPAKALVLIRPEQEPTRTNPCATSVSIHVPT